MSRLRLIAAVAGTLVAGVLAAAPASADIGAGISANPVSLAGVARGGRTYRLPSVQVVNSGTEVSTYHVFVGSLGQTKGVRSVPLSWVRATPNDFVLQAKQSATVSLALVVPKGARGGNYASGLKASASPQGTGTVTFGATAATNLSFRVAAAPSLLGRVTGSRWLGRGAFALGVLTALVLLSRLFGLRVEVVRRQPVVDGWAALERGASALGDLEFRRRHLDTLALRARSIQGCEYIAASSGLY